jgi:hypothetical protein
MGLCSNQEVLEATDWILRGNINDWEGPSSDVYLDKTVDEGWADKSKLLITGGSYAGYLTAWLLVMIIL